MRHSHRPASKWRYGLDRGEVDPGRDDLSFRDPPRGIVGADDLRVSQTAVGELLGRLAADVRADEVEDGLLAGRLQDRELEPLRNECEPEVEVEDVRGRQQPCERAKLRGLAAPRRPVRQPEVDVGFRVGRLGVEDDEPGIDALSPQRLHVRPADAREVDRAVNDLQLSHSTWSK